MPFLAGWAKRDIRTHGGRDEADGTRKKGGDGVDEKGDIMIMGFGVYAG